MFYHSKGEIFDIMVFVSIVYDISLSRFLRLVLAIII